MIKALEVVKTGIGMPAFALDKSFIEYMTTERHTSRRCAQLPSRGVP